MRRETEERDRTDSMPLGTWEIIDTRLSDKDLK